MTSLAKSAVPQRSSPSLQGLGSNDLPEAGVVEEGRYYSKSLWERDRSFAHFSFGDRVFIVSADYHLLVFILSWDFIFFMIAYYIKKALGNRYYGIIVNRLPW